ncbi:MAG: chitobiase/beta-hexosaminidase C-terminal domain-containing protein, partial [Candidatus Cloacimonetes bacterium]|nr:chitobiase/beta-hexosaminidase C-terminal domain-containing protein [Candidatus Cloacimonadota bacterium]
MNKKTYLLIILISALCTLWSQAPIYSGTGNFTKLEETDTITTGFYVLTDLLGTKALTPTLEYGQLEASDLTPANFDGDDIVNPSLNIVWHITNAGYNVYHIAKVDWQCIAAAPPNLSFSANTNATAHWDIYRSTSPTKSGWVIKNSQGTNPCMQYSESSDVWLLLPEANTTVEHSELYRLDDPIEYERIVNAADLVSGYYVVLGASATTSAATTTNRAMDTSGSTTNSMPVKEIFYNTSTLYAPESSVWRIDRAGDLISFFSVEKEEYIQYNTTGANITLVSSLGEEGKFGILNTFGTYTPGHKFLRIHCAGDTTRFLQYNSSASMFRIYGGTQNNLAFFKMDLPLEPLTQVATPNIVASIPAPRHNPFTVTISCDTADADIYYTTDGSDPDLPGATLYAGTPISITAASTTVKAIAKKAGFDDSEEASVVYAITTALPVFSVSGGLYHTTRTVALSCTTTDADIFYTYGSGTPDLPYTEPLEIAETTTVRAIATHTEYGETAVASVTYTITDPFEGTFTRITSLDDIETGLYVIASGVNGMKNNVHSGNYFEVENVTISGDEDDEIEDPNSNFVWLIENHNDGEYYQIISTLNDQYLAYEGNPSSGNNNAWLHETGDTDVEKWFIEAASGLFLIENANASNTRYLKYNTGSPRFACYLSGQTNPALYKYTPQVLEQLHPPVISPHAGTYNTAIEVTIAPATEDSGVSVAIYYTTDGSQPDEDSELYTTSFTVDEDTYVKAVSYAAGYLPSDVTTAHYIIDLDDAAEVEFYPSAEAPHHNPFTVQLHSNTVDAEIYYTLDESDPALPTAILYDDEPLEITAPVTTIRAIAKKTGLTDSEETTVTYEITTADLVFSVLSGTFTTPQTIALTCSTISAEIYYTTEDETPAVLYTEPLEIVETTTIKAFATHDDYGDSDEVTHTYTIEFPQVATPVCTPLASAAQHNPFELTITCTTDGADIYYSLDESTPSLLYSEPLELDSPSTTIRAVAKKLYMTESEEVTAEYNITTALPVFSVTAGVYSTPFELALSGATTDSEIYYTLGEGTPDLLYTDPLEITEQTTVRAFATHTEYGESAVVSATYYFSETYEGTFTRISSVDDIETGYYVIAAGVNGMRNNAHYSNYFEVLGVTLTGEENDEIEDPTSNLVWYIENHNDGEYYQIISILNDQYLAYEGDPSSGNNNAWLHETGDTDVEKWSIEVVSGLFQIKNVNATNSRYLRYNSSADPNRFACYLSTALGMQNPALYKYTTDALVQLHPPVITPEEGIYNTHIDVTIVPAEEDEGIDISIYYTTDGTDPDQDSTLYTGSFSVGDDNDDTMVKAKAYAAGYRPSVVASAHYEIDHIHTQEVHFYPSEDAPHHNPFTVELHSHTEDADIYYTLDESDPDLPTAILYDGDHIDISGSITTIRAIAKKDGLYDSPETTDTYEITTADLVFSVAGGTFTTPQTVELTCLTIGAEIYYTFEEDTPDLLYTEPLEISETTTIRAFASHSEYGESAVVSASYVFTTVIEGTFTRITSVEDIETGYYVITSGANAMTNNIDGTSFYSTSVTLTGADDSEIEDPSKNVVWYIEYLQTEQKYTIQSAMTDEYLDFHGTANAIYVSQEVTDDQQKWTIEIVEDSELFEIKNAETTNRYVRYNATDTIPRYRCYTGGQTNPMLYKLEQPLPTDQVATPVVTASAPAPHYNPFTVSISCATEDALIYYTVDGTDPAPATALLYEGVAIEIALYTTTLKAIAVKTGMWDSEVTTREYTISTANPVFSVAGGLYHEPFELALSTVTTGAEIYYTFEGGTPDLLYTEPLEIAETITIRAFATHPEFGETDIVLATYYIPAPFEGTFIQIDTTAQVETGYYLITSGVNAMTNTNESNSFFSMTVPLTGVNQSQITNPTNQVIWYIEYIPAEQKYTIQSVLTGEYIDFHGTSNAIYTSNEVTSDAQKWTIARNEAPHLFDIINAETTNRYVAYNGGDAIPRYRCYNTGQAKPRLYKLTDDLVVLVPPSVSASCVFEEYHLVMMGSNPLYNPSGTAIHYTLDGTEPTLDSPICTASFWIFETTIVKAKCFLEGYTPSETVTRYYDLVVPGENNYVRVNTGDLIENGRYMIVAETGGTYSAMTLGLLPVINKLTGLAVDEQVSITGNVIINPAQGLVWDITALATNTYAIECVFGNLFLSFPVGTPDGQINSSANFTGADESWQIDWSGSVLQIKPANDTSKYLQKDEYMGMLDVFACYGSPFTPITLYKYYDLDAESNINITNITPPIDLLNQNGDYQISANVTSELALTRVELRFWRNGFYQQPIEMSIAPNMQYTTTLAQGVNFNHGDILAYSVRAVDNTQAEEIVTGGSLVAGITPVSMILDNGEDYEGLLAKTTGQAINNDGLLAPVENNSFYLQAGGRGVHIGAAPRLTPEPASVGNIYDVIGEVCFDRGAVWVIATVINDLGAGEPLPIATGNIPYFSDQTTASSHVRSLVSLKNISLNTADYHEVSD